MTRRRFAIAMAWMLFAAMPSGDAIASYRIVELVLPADARGGLAADINAAGDVVGHIFDAQKGRHRATIWRAPDHLPYLLADDQVTYRDSEANRINDRGDILGELHPRKVGQTDTAVWGSDDSFVVLARVQGQQWSRAYDINAGNAVVGTVMPRNGTAGAVAWPTAGRIRWLAGNDASFREGEAYAVNDAGMVVGHARGVGDSVTQAFRWTPKEGMRSLGAGVSSTAYDVNEAGQAVGVSNGSAVIWEADGRMRDLGGLRGGGADYLQGDRINNLGIVIGRTQGSGESTDFVWTPGSGIVRIADAIDVGDPWYARLHSGDAYLYVYGLNDAGMIVGALSAPEIPYGIPVMLAPQPSCPLPPVCRGPAIADSAGGIGG